MKLKPQHGHHFILKAVLESIMLHYEFYYYTEDYLGEARKKNQLRTSKKANVLLTKIFYTYRE